MEPSNPQPVNPYLIPGAIVVAGLLIAAAVLVRGPVAPSPNPNAAGQPPSLAFAPIASGDHIRGNPNAKVKIIEYSDFECPFCKQFHFTMEKLFAEYGPKGDLAWIYREFPLENLHPRAFHEAEGAECAASLGGNDAFWKYADKIFSITPSNNRLDPALIPKIASGIGLDPAKFNACLDGGAFKQKIASQIQDAIASGSQGTPWSIMLTPKGEKVPINGAQPYEAVKAAIDLALTQK